MCCFEDADMYIRIYKTLFHFTSHMKVCVVYSMSRFFGSFLTLYRGDGHKSVAEG